MGGAPLHFGPIQYRFWFIMCYVLMYLLRSGFFTRIEDRSHRSVGMFPSSLLASSLRPSLQVSAARLVECAPRVCSITSPVIFQDTYRYLARECMHCGSGRRGYFNAFSIATQAGTVAPPGLGMRPIVIKMRLAGALASSSAQSVSDIFFETGRPHTAMIRSPI
jgi:hypothetical protein